VELLLTNESAKAPPRDKTEESAVNSSGQLAAIFSPASLVRAPSQIQNAGKQTRKMNNMPSATSALKSRTSHHPNFSSAWRRPTDSQPSVQTRIENGGLSGLKRSVSMCGPMPSRQSSVTVPEAEPRPPDCISPVKVDATEESSHNPTAPDLFAAAAPDSASSSSRAKPRPGQPLADRMRPTLWADFVGQAQVRDVLKELSHSGLLPSMILWGPPGDQYPRALSLKLRRTYECKNLDVHCCAAAVRPESDLFVR
jgi:hypothetical protein